MRILSIIFMMIFGIIGASFAATVNLNDGRSVQGNIIKQDAKSLQISVDGVTMTYYSDEIKDVDGQPFVTAPSAPAARVVAPAAAPTTGAETQGSDSAVSPVAESVPSAQSNGNAQDKKVLILKFIDVFGTKQALINNFDQMIKQIEKEKPEEAIRIRDRVNIDEIIERLVPIYDRNFTSEDLKAFITFYSSAQGQKLITTIPELMKESVKESVKYMQEKFPEAK